MEVSVYIWPVYRTIIHSSIVTPALFCCQVLQTVNTNLVSELHKRISISWTAKVLSNPLQYFCSAFPSFKVYISTHCYLLSQFTKFVPDISGNNLEMRCLGFQDLRAVTVHIVVNITTRVCVCLIFQQVPVTQRNIPEDLNLQQHRYANQKSCMLSTTSGSGY